MDNLQLVLKLAELRASCAKIERIDPCLPTYDRLCKFLDNLDDGHLLFVSLAKIKFLSPLARNRCSRRGIQ